MCVMQHLNLANDAITLRLNKNELVFSCPTTAPIGGDFIVVRTMQNARVACPKIYLTSVTTA